MRKVFSRNVCGRKMNHLVWEMANRRDVALWRTRKEPLAVGEGQEG